MTIEELFNNKILWFDNTLDLKKFEEFVNHFTNFLEYQQIDSKNLSNVKKTFDRLKKEGIGDHGEDGIGVYYLRFFTRGISNPQFEINGYIGDINIEDELTNAKEAYEERVGEGYQPIANNFLTDYDETSSLFDSLNEQEDDFEWLDLNVPLPADESFVITFCRTPVTWDFIVNLPKMLPNYIVEGLEDLDERWVKNTYSMHDGEIVMYFDIRGKIVEWTGWDNCRSNYLHSYSTVFTAEKFMEIYGKKGLTENKIPKEERNPFRVGDVVMVNGVFQGRRFHNNFGVVKYYKGGGDLIGIDFDNWTGGHNGVNVDRRDGSVWEFFNRKLCNWDFNHSYTIELVEADPFKELYEQETITNCKIGDTVLINHTEGAKLLNTASKRGVILSKEEIEEGEEFENGSRWVLLLAIDGITNGHLGDGQEECKENKCWWISENSVECINFDETSDMFNQLYEQEIMPSSDEFYTEFFDMIYPLIIDKPFYCFSTSNRETPMATDRHSDVANDGVSDLYYVGTKSGENTFYVYWRDKYGDKQYADDYTKDAIGGHFYRGEWNLKEWYRRGTNAKDLGGDLPNTEDLFNQIF